MVYAAGSQLRAAGVFLIALVMLGLLAGSFAGGRVSASADTPSKSEFDPFGLLPEGDTPKPETDTSETPFGQMPDMRLMRRALEIIGGVSDLSQLTAEQLEALAKLGIDPKALERNADLLERLIEDSRTSLDNTSEASDRQSFLLYIGAGTVAAALVGWWLRRRLKH